MAACMCVVRTQALFVHLNIRPLCLPAKQSNIQSNEKQLNTQFKQSHVWITKLQNNRISGTQATQKIKSSLRLIACVKYHSPAFIRHSKMLAPVISSLDEIYCIICGWHLLPIYEENFKGSLTFGDT